jgi:hypothetical protein
VAVGICIDVYAGSGPWVSVAWGIVWLDDVLLAGGPHVRDRRNAALVRDGLRLRVA